MENENKSNPDKLHYREHESHSENPFMSGLVRHLSKTNKNKLVHSKMVSSEDPDRDKLTGFMTDHAAGDMLVSELEVVDAEKFTKVYHSSIKETHGLSDKALRILMGYIAPKLGKDETQIIFNLDECVEVISYSKTSIYAGLAELLNSKIIAKSELNWLIYIDPVFMFNGDRLAVTKVYLKRGSEKAMIARNLEEMYNDQQKQLDDGIED